MLNIDHPYRSSIIRMDRSCIYSIDPCSRWIRDRSLWDYFGITLASFWDHFRIITASFQDHFGIILGSFWHHFGIILASFCHHFGIILPSFCHCFAVILEQFSGYFPVKAGKGSLVLSGAPELIRDPPPRKSKKGKTTQGNCENLLGWDSWRKRLVAKRTPPELLRYSE